MGIILIGLAYGIIVATHISTSAQSNLSESFWSNGSKMPTPRSATAAAILDDKIYVAGGQGCEVKKDKIVEVYDIKSDVWIKGTSLPEPLDHLGMASYDGKLYVV